MCFRCALLFACCSLLLVGVRARAQYPGDFELPPISYSASTPRAINVLQACLEAPEVKFAANDRDALKALLAQLDIPVESQLLVFSKTSLQRRRISPDRPRALYFSDSIYVGWVPGGLAEVIMMDSQLGPVFYSIDLSSRRNGGGKIERATDCLRCHGGTFIRDIPGVFARSVFASGTGEPLLRHGTLVVDDVTPFQDRWGGWYVTGYHGSEVHRGNTLADEQGDALQFTPSAERPDTLTEFFETDEYLATTSDVVALLVFEHQLAMHNTLTRASFTARRMIAYQHGLQTAFNEPLTDEPTYDSVKSVIASTVEDVVDRLLFRKAAVIPEGVVGTKEFRARFAKDAPRSVAGQALKDFQLRGRIFAQRCSFLIYSDAFRELPETLKRRIFARLKTALQSSEPEDRYAYLEPEEKRRIYDLLMETHPDAKRLWTRAPEPALAAASR